MTRMRTLKPGFFTNDQLAELPPLARILFAGLWCLSDREGRLEDRPRRIKAEILPFDSCNVDRLLDQLEERGFILRYEIENQRFIQVLNFLRHQNPHVREPASVIPAPCEHSAGPVLGTEKAVPSTSSRARVPDHGIQSLEQSLESSAGPDEPDPPRDDRIDALYAHFKARIQPRSRLCPRKKIAARLKRFSLDELKAGIDHFAEDPWWMEHNADKGAEWFFESDARAEQFLLMAPRPQPTPLTGRNGHSPEPVRHIVDRTFENPLTRDE
jgi:hypothetical protein